MSVRRMLRYLTAIAAVLGLWAAIMVALPFVGPPGRLVAVVGNRPQTIRAVATAGGRIVDIRRGAVLARSDQPDFPTRLYANGAFLVLEGRIAAGCFRSS